MPDRTAKERSNIYEKIVLIYLILATILFNSILNEEAWAGGNDIQLLTTIIQSEFENLSRELGLSLSYIPLAPAEPLGITGFDIGIEATMADIGAGEIYWQKAVADQSVPSTLIIPKIHAQKGLPFGIDLGIIYSAVPDTNIALLGGEVKWAFIKGSAVTPSLALRGTYTKLLGVDDIDLHTYSADLSVSKGFGMLTPYAGVGQVWIESKEKVALLNLDKASLSETKFFLGVKLSLAILNFVAEADFSDIPMYSLRANIGF